MDAHTGMHAGPRVPWRMLRWAAAGLLLALPWIAMRATDEVDWTGSDFIAFGTLLVLACGGYELATVAASSAIYRAAAALALASAFMLVWITLAVGVIGSTANPANLLYGAVLTVGVLGTALARGRSGHMVAALAATAIAHALVALVAALDGWLHTLILNAVFIGLWLGSAALFQVAAQVEGAGRRVAPGEPPPRS